MDRVVHEADRVVHEADRVVHEADRVVHEADRVVHEADRVVHEAVSKTQIFTAENLSSNLLILQCHTKISVTLK